MGTERDERLATRFDYDAVVGTVLNRFTIQAVIGHPLTVYGEGGQTRGIIDIRDTVRCIQLACENPANRGEFRVFNQMTESMSVAQIAETVKAASPEDITIEYLDNPRVELPEHYYNVKHTKLVELGLEPHLLSDTLIESLFEVTKRYAHRVRPADSLRAASRGNKTFKVCSFSKAEEGFLGRLLALDGTLHCSGAPRDDRGLR